MKPLFFTYLLLNLLFLATRIPLSSAQRQEHRARERRRDFRRSLLNRRR